jgi:Acyl-CoA dehydrogenase, C-terminal domain
MDLALPEVAEQFALSAERAIVALGGLELARRAEADPSVRAGVLKGALDALGVADLDPRADLESAAMAAELVRIAGRYVVPFPVVGYVMAEAGHAVPLALASAPPLCVDHGDLFARWSVFDFSGRCTEAVPAGPAFASRLAPFVTPLAALKESHEAQGAPVALLCTLWASYLLGVAEHALELAVAHVKGRVQFGRPLSALQSVRFSIADATVAVDGLRELIRFTLWRVAQAKEEARADALAARLAAQDVSQPVLRLAQQLHGAAGLADEYDISVLVRHFQPALRLPVDADAMSDIVFDALKSHGFATLFPLRPDEAGHGA